MYIRSKTRANLFFVMPHVVPQEPLDATQPVTLTDLLMEHANTLHQDAIHELPMPGEERRPPEAAEQARFRAELCRDYHPSCNNWAKAVRLDDPPSFPAQCSLNALTVDHRRGSVRSTPTTWWAQTHGRHTVPKPVNNARHCQ